jgi:basic membrane lipoprotein Med (substrate-binding protein (PBP1-ABC) superfamily)
VLSARQAPTQWMTQANAAAYLAGLVQRHCDVIVAVGPAQLAAASATAGRVSTTRFLLVGGAPSASRPNVTVLDATGPDQVRARVRDELIAAVRSSG